MNKYFTAVLLLSGLSLPVFANEAIFSNSETETLELKPSTSSTEPLLTSNQTQNSYTKTTTSTLKEKAENSALSDKNFVNAVNNLDTAQVEIREQLTNYSVLMGQAKNQYLAKKEEYKNYKKQYNSLKKKNKQIERSKKIIQNNIESATTTTTKTSTY